jgi:hypothetical protein
MAAREDTIAGSFSVVVVSFYKEGSDRPAWWWCIYVRTPEMRSRSRKIRADRRKADEFCGGDLLDGFSHARQN